MAQKRYDASTKFLFEFQPEALLYLLDEPVEGEVAVVDEDLIEVLESDLAITAAADKVLKIARPAALGGPWIAALDFQAARFAHLPMRTTYYKVALIYRLQLPVRSVILLLSPQADSPNLTGVWEPPSDPCANGIRAEYDVIRIWEVPTEKLLAGPLGLLPLAPLTLAKADEADEALPGVVERIQARFEQEAPQSKVPDLWTATHFLMGLTFEEALIERVLQGVHGMKESVTYQKAVQEGVQKGREEGREEGLIEGERRLLLRLGSKRFGAPSEAARQAVAAIDSLERLETLAERVYDVESWEALLAEPNGSA